MLPAIVGDLEIESCRLVLADNDTGCHVMERESFESTEVAEILNNYFIPIKIDREERPDIDAIYMNYVQATTGSGGWPLNVFITPDLEPVFGGTYWPGPNHSMTAVGTAVAETVGFLEILGKMKVVWQEQEGKCRQSARDITKQLREFAEEGVHGREQGEDRGDADGLEIELLEEAFQHFERRYDSYNGGFASAPKFPTPVNLRFLLQLGQWSSSTVSHVVGEEECSSAQIMAVVTLRKMARGGIRDQVGYGFSRYSVTKDWSLPHFEKMLYDQAQLLDVYLDAYLISHDPEMLGAVYDIIKYVTSAPIAAPTGGFYSAEDADSYPTKTDTEKREGAYYVWTTKELSKILGSRDMEIFARFYGVKSDGNVAHHHDPHDELINQNVLHITTTPGQLAKDLSIPESAVASSLKTSRQKLRDYRDANRPRPSLDDKIIVSWNGLAITSLSRAASILHSIDPATSETCVKSATQAAAFIRRELYSFKEKRLYRVYSASRRGDTFALCDDYAFLIQGLIDLYEATFDDTHLAWADELQKIQLDQFRDPQHPAGFYTTPSPHPPDLILRLKSGMDSAEPSGNNISARNLYRLGSMLEDETYLKAGKDTVEAFEAEILQFPFCFAGMLDSVVYGRLGMRGIVVMGGASSTSSPSPPPPSTASTATPDPTTNNNDNNPPPSQVPQKTLAGHPLTDAAGNDTTTASSIIQQETPTIEIDAILKKIRSRVVPDRTVVLIDGEKGQWLRTRNPLLRDVNLDGSQRGKVLVCQGGICKEGRVDVV